MTEVAMEYLEDMFKEVVKKLYGEQDLGSSGSLKMMQNIEAAEKAESSQSSLQAEEMSAIEIKSEALTDLENAWISSDENLDWTDSSIASYNVSQQLFRCNDCECVGMLSRVAEHWLGTHANLRVFQCSQCSYASAWARCVRMHLMQQHNIALDSENFDNFFKENPVLGEVTEYLERIKSKVESLKDEQEQKEIHVVKESNIIELDPVKNGMLEVDIPTETQFETQVITMKQKLSPSPQDTQTEDQVLTTDEMKPLETVITIQIPAGLDNRTTNSKHQTQSNSDKRYNCSFCLYRTDRRDLYTRHENIHKEEKPFHCYVCQKQFNRADHVKKHFLRMHRNHTYENNKIKRDLSNFNNQQFKQFITTQKPSLSDIKIPFTYSANVIPKIAIVQQRPTVIEDGSSVLNALNNQNLNNSTLTNIQSSFNITTRTITLEHNSIGIGTSDVPNSFSVTTASPTVSNQKKPGPVKEKRFICGYCSWSGTDNWCLKRHLNTHIKPFNCSLCEYKAARPERLATHVAKVHNKILCSKCSFLTHDKETLDQHMEQHVI